MLLVRKLINFDTRFFQTNYDSLCCESKIVTLAHKNRLPLTLSSPILFIYVFTFANSWQGHHNIAWRQILLARNSPPPLPLPHERDHHTGDYVPYSLRTMRWFSNAPQILDVQGLCDGAYGLSSLSEKTRKPNLLHMSLQRQHFLLSVGPSVV